MPESTTLDVGMDVHTDSMAVAYVARDHDAPVIDLGTMGTRQADIDHLLRPRHSKAKHLVFVYEAGPCGDWLSRSRRNKGDGCWVVAPSVIPKKAGDRVTTDRRDAVPLARFRRSGDLTPVDVPSGEDEAIRDRCRAREEAIGDLKTATFRLNALLLRHDSRSTGQATWGPAHRRWLREVVCPTPAQPMVCQADVRAVTAHTERLPRLEQELHEPVQSWRLHPVVEALQALRGGPLTVAVTTVAELGDLTRVENPRPLMTSLGLIPSESSSGERRRQGASTTAGHTQARRALVEGAWAYRYPAQVSRPLPRRLEQRPKPIQDIRWKAPVRRCQRVRRVMARGQHANPVVVAMARELGGCMGAMAQQVPVTPSPMDDPCTHHCEVANVQGKRRGPGVVSPATACRDRQASSCLERGRHPTDARQVVTNPRRSAGSTVGLTGSVSSGAQRSTTIMKP